MAVFEGMGTYYEDVPLPPSIWDLAVPMILGI